MPEYEYIHNTVQIGKWWVIAEEWACFIGSTPQEADHNYLLSIFDVPKS